MGLIVVKDDFTGKYDLVKSINDKIESYIETYEESYLRELLGIDLFNLYKANVVNHLPVNSSYLTITNPLFIEQNGYSIVSKGIKDMLLGFIFFEYVRDNKIKQSMSGSVVNSVDNSNNDFTQEFLFQRYNESIDIYKNIQLYIELNKATYPTYNGFIKGYSY
jgi:hypothetical protein